MIRLLELRSAWGAGGGPEKTILLSAARHDPARVRADVCYLRSVRDLEFEHGVRARAREHGVAIREVEDERRLDLACVAKLRKLARSADVIHAHDYKTDLYGLLLGRGGGRARLVATAHGWTGENAKVRLYQRLDLLALRFYDRVIAVSGATRDVLLEGGVAEERVVVLPNGIDERAWHPRNEDGDLRRELGIAPGELVVGTVARLSLEKGVDQLLAALPFANAELERRGRPRPHVLVAGDGPERADLEWTARLRGIAAQVRFLGHRHDVRRVLNTLDVAVVPSRVENLPNALLEAMALGKACAAFSVGGVPEVLGETGVLVRSFDREGLGRAIASLAADPAARERLGREARARVERHFSFADRLRRIEAIYEDVCREPAALAEAAASAGRARGRFTWLFRT